jgi:hypothetical protein
MTIQRDHPRATGDTGADVEATNHRRAALRALALGGAGAAVGAVAFGTSASAGDRAGTQINGNATELGEVNTSDLPTIIDFTPAAPLTAGPSAFSAGGYVPPADALAPAAVGGYGDDTVPNGVHGSTIDGAGVGVIAANLANAAASDTDPVPTALAIASANGAHVRFVGLPSAVSGPTPGNHVAGEMYVDADGTLWFTVPVEDDPDAIRFVRLAATAAAGTYHPIEPQRAYDSRQPGYAVRGVLAPNTSRVLSVANGHTSNGTVSLADAVPAGATAVHINVTAAEQTGRNWFAVTSGDATSTATSIVNWETGSTQIANAVTVPVNADREIKVFCGDQVGSSHVIIDVFGYHL